MSNKIIIEKHKIICPHCKKVLNVLNPNVEAQSVRVYKFCPKCGKEISYD